MIFRIVRSLANNTLSLPSLLFNPFVPNAPILYPLKNSENLTVFWCFQGVEKGCIWNEWLKEIAYWRLPHLSIHWLIMRVGFEIKGSKPKSSVNSLNLFKVLIVSSASFLQGCAVFHPILHLHFHHPHL